MLIKHLGRRASIILREIGVKDISECPSLKPKILNSSGNIPLRCEARFCSSKCTHKSDCNFRALSKPPLPYEVYRQPISKTEKNPLIVKGHDKNVTHPISQHDLTANFSNGALCQILYHARMLISTYIQQNQQNTHLEGHKSQSHVRHVPASQYPRSHHLPFGRSSPKPRLLSA